MHVWHHIDTNHLRGLAIYDVEIAAVGYVDGMNRPYSNTIDRCRVFYGEAQQ